MTIGVMNMQEIIDKIRVLYPEFSQSYKTVASYVMEKYHEIPFLSVTSLAKKIGVSDTTIIKFCIELGFEGFGSFKKKLSEYVHSEITMYTKFEEIPDSLTELNIMDSIQNQDIRNIQSTLGNTSNRKNFAKVLPMLESAKKIYTLGFRTSSLLAEFLAIGLRQQNWHVQSIIPGYGEYIDKMCLIQPEDLVIAFVFPRYSKDVVKMLEILKQKGTPILLITNAGLSPVQTYADVVFTCDIASSTHIASHTGSISFINALLTTSAVSHKQKTKEYLKEIEKMFVVFDSFINKQ
jgi:DNA-binding MurR/RpiR family transcriptional regulator